LWRQVSKKVDDKITEQLKVVTEDYYLIKKEETIAVLGFMPSGAISGRVVLWLGFVGGYIPRIADIRPAKKLFEEIVSQHPRLAFRAEVFSGDETARRFAEFFGFEQVDVRGDRLLLERK
jgi:hypothetical protein